MTGITNYFLKSRKRKKYQNVFKMLIEQEPSVQLEQAEPTVGVVQ